MFSKKAAALAIEEQQTAAPEVANQVYNNMLISSPKGDELNGRIRSLDRKGESWWSSRRGRDRQASVL